MTLSYIFTHFFVNIAWYNRVVSFDTNKRDLVVIGHNLL